jgi:ligand-binding sensor domain-containing protein/signal transduction histidine kinase
MRNTIKSSLISAMQVPRIPAFRTSQARITNMKVYPVCNQGIRPLLTRGLAVLGVCAILLNPIFAIPVSAQSDAVNFENISTEQGLSQSTVHAILQDQQGFLWFATEGGLDKYDGYQFTVYQHDPGDPKTLSDNLISFLYQDRQGNLWVGTSVGLDRFDPQKETALHPFQGPNLPPGLAGQDVSAILQDRMGELWIGTDGGGLAALDLSTNQFRLYQHTLSDPHALAGNSVNIIFEDSAGELWIGTDGGLDHFLRSSDQFELAFGESSPKAASIGKNPVYALAETTGGDLWIGTNKGLFRWERRSNQLIQYQHDPNGVNEISDNTVTCLLVETGGQLWIGTRTGLTLFVPQQNTFTSFLHDPNDPSSLASDSIRSLYEDRSGALWIGTSAGLSKYARATHKFSLLAHVPGSANSLSDSNVWAALKDHSGGLWVGTFSAGLNHLDLQSGRVTIYQHDPLDPGSLSSNEIRTLMEDHTGTLWIGTERGGLDRFNASTNTFTQYLHDPSNPDSLGGNNVFSLSEDEFGKLWIGTSDGGLNRMDPATGTFVHYQHNDGNPNTLSNDDVRTIHIAYSSMMWVGTFGGLNLFYDQGNVFLKYLHQPAISTSLSSDMVASFYEDNYGTLWIGTFGGGLNRLDNATRTFSHFTMKDGLPDNTVYCILGDVQGNLWLSTNKGLSKFNPVTHSFRNYDISDGLQGNQFNPGACTQGQDGEMYFGGTHGLNAFYPARVQDNPIPPPVVITSFQEFNQTIQTDLPENETISLSYRDNFIAFTFSALDYNAPEKNQYAYQLVGVDSDWVQAGTRRYASYTNLRGGDYTFRVKAANNDGVWNSTGTAISIHIIPPFWQTWWFIGIVCLVAGAGAIGGYRLRVRDIESRNRELAKRVEQRTHDLATLNAISGVVNSSLDLKGIMEDALERTMQITDMSPGSALVLDEATQELILIAYRGTTATNVQLGARWPLAAALAGRPLDGTHPLTWRVATDYPESPLKANLLREGVQLVVGIPLLAKEKMVGMLVLNSCTPRTLTPEESSLLSAIGQQVGIAVENARLYEQAERRTRELAALNSISGVVNQSLDLSKILNNAMERMIEFMHMDGGLAFSLEESPDGREDGQYLKLLAYRGVSDEFAKLVDHLPLESSIVLKAIKTGKPYVYRTYDHPNPQIRKANQEGGLRIGISLPLVAKGALIGTLSLLADQPREFTPEELSLLDAIGQQVGMAVVNARLYEQAEQTAIASERSRLARELHDSVTQLLYSVTLYAEAAGELLSSGKTEAAAENCHDLRDTAQEALREMRLLIFELHRPALEQGGLAAALQARLDAVERRGGMHADLQVEGSERISLAVQAELYNIAHEALNNALKHAHASSVQIHLWFGDDLTEMQISDDGVGFEPGQNGMAGGFGIPGMQERAKKIGGNLMIESAPGKGTRIIVEVPLNPAFPPDQPANGSLQKGIE